MFFSSLHVLILFKISKQFYFERESGNMMQENWVNKTHYQNMWILKQPILVALVQIVQKVEWQLTMLAMWYLKHF